MALENWYDRFNRVAEGPKQKQSNLQEVETTTKPVEKKRNTSFTDEINDLMDLRNFPLGLNPYEPFPFEELTPLKFDKFKVDMLGFEDMGDHYRLVTNLGGLANRKENQKLDEDHVKVEIHGKIKPYVEISYEYKEEDTQRGYFYTSHSQKTSVSLPVDADADTVDAFINDDGDIVVTVEKAKVRHIPGFVRDIPVLRKPE